MATNNFTVVFEETFGEVEPRLRQYAPSMAIRGTIAQNGMDGGRTYQYANDPDDLARPSQTNQDVAFNDIDGAEVIMDIGENQFEYSFRLDRRDKNKLRRAPAFIAGKSVDALKQLHQQFDGQYFGEVLDEANTVFDNSDLTGGTGSITLTGSNALQLVTEALAKLDNVAGPVASDIAMVMTPNMIAKLRQSNVANGFRVADSILRETNNNELGEYAGARIFKSQFLTHTADLAYTNGTNWSDGETLILKGQTFTARTAPALAGEFDIKASADLTATVLVAAINAPGVTVAGDFIALGTFNSDAVANLNGMTATLNTTTDIIGLVNKRGSFTAVSTLDGAVATGIGQGALTAATVHVYLGGIGSNNAPELAMAEQGVYTEVGEEPRQPTSNFMQFADFGTATPFFVKSKIEDVRIFAT